MKIIQCAIGNVDIGVVIKFFKIVLTFDPLKCIQLLLNLFATLGRKLSMLLNCLCEVLSSCI